MSGESRSTAGGAAAEGLVVSPRGEPFQVVGRAGPVDLQGAPPIPAEAREELLVIKDGELFVCTRTDGDIVPAQPSGEGFYAWDTRYISELRLEVDGARPVPLSYVAEAERAVVDATNASLSGPGGPALPQLSLSITRELTVGSGRLYCVLRAHNYLRDSVSSAFSVVLAADFADMFEVRGGVSRHARGHALAPKRTAHGATLAYLGEDDVFRETLIAFQPQPDHWTVEQGGVRAMWSLELAARGAAAIEITIEPSRGGRRSPRRRLTAVVADLERRRLEWRSRCTVIRSDNEHFDALLARSADDLHALIMRAGKGRIVAAGIPWYVAPFGRDALLTAGEAMILNSDLARDALELLAGLQATRDDPWRDAEPGKIIHELRAGELAGAGIIPHTPYYGAVDTTPLFLMRAADYYAWTGDIDTLRALRSALDRALRWIADFGDRDGDGFVEYERRSPAGLQNQGWKDSADSIVHADGSLAEGPIALVEVQGYLYAAKRGVSVVYDALGDHETAERLRDEAARLRDAFNDAFWNADEGTFALALDGRKRQVASVTSNPGHCLYCGIVDSAKAPALVERLLAPDMFCGWGVRTLSSANPAFNPMSYHNGSIWPHDNAIIAAGLKRYGHDDAAQRIATSLLAVASSVRDARLPELYCGFDRDRRPLPVAYPVACIPQAWAAAAPLLLVQSMLGIAADAPNRALAIEQPMLPSWLRSLRLERLRVGDALVTLEFNRERGPTGFTLLEQSGSLTVTMAAGR